MELNQFFSNIKAALRHFASYDARTKIAPFDFATSLVLLFKNDRGHRSISSMRRAFQENFLITLSRGGFWERLSSKSLLKNLMKAAIHLMRGELEKSILFPSLLRKLNIDGICLLDSTTITLPSRARSIFPGIASQYQHAAVKWHVLFDLTNRSIPWCEITSGTASDVNFVPKYSQLKNKLLIFDLGYFSFQHFFDLQQKEIFFLTRIKSTVRVKIISVRQGLSKDYIGKDLTYDPIPENIPLIEFEAELGSDCDGVLKSRAVGVWNQKERKYHWYLTNLTAPAELIYSLYRLRWQIELVFKTMKSTLNIGKITTANKTIIYNLVLASLIASLISFPLSRYIMEGLCEEKRMRMSIQRTGLIFVHLIPEIKILLRDEYCGDALCRLNNKLKLFANELIDPQKGKRTTSMATCKAILESLS